MARNKSNRRAFLAEMSKSTTKLSPFFSKPGHFKCDLCEKSYGVKSILKECLIAALLILGRIRGISIPLGERCAIGEFLGQLSSSYVVNLMIF